MPLRFLIALILSFPLVAQVGSPFMGIGMGRQWFVDLTGGSDSGTTGHSPAQAYKTITKLQTNTILPYDHIYLKAGTCNKWREMIDLRPTSPAHVSIASYGAGAAPVMDASDIATGTDACGNVGTGTWVLDTGTTWKIAVTTPTDNGSGWSNFWKDGLPPTIATSQANCEATVGSYWPSSNLGGTWTMYYNSGSASNPGSDGHLYEYASRESGIAAGSSDYLIVNGANTRRNHTNDGSLVAGNYATILNVTASDGSKHNLLFGDGSNLNNVSAINATSGDATCCTLFIYYPKSGASTGIGNPTWNNLTGTLATADNRIDLIFGHYITGPGLSSATVANLTCTNVTKSVLSGPWSSVNGITATNCGGISVGGAGTYSIRNANLGTVSSGAAVTVQYPSTDLTIDGLTSTVSGTGGNIRIQSAATGSSIRISNSTLSDTQPFGNIIQFEGVQPALLSITGNTFLSPVQTHYVSIDSGFAPATATFSGNTYHFPNASSWNVWGGTSYDFSGTTGRNAWKALSFTPDASSTFLNSTP